MTRANKSKHYEKIEKIVTAVMSENRRDHYKRRSYHRGRNTGDRGTPDPVAPPQGEIKAHAFVRYSSLMFILVFVGGCRLLVPRLVQ